VTGISVQAPLRQHVPVPHRNLMLASLAASYAAQLEVGAVMLALNREDLGAYSTASSSFLAATDATYKVRLGVQCKACQISSRRKELFSTL
jgi:7-cyano-7-deazaguanine synthase in queuosine biosynthesis